MGLGVLCNGLQLPFAQNALCSVDRNERYALKLPTARLYPTEVKMQEHPRTEDYGRQKLQPMKSALIASLD